MWACFTSPAPLGLLWLLTLVRHARTRNQGRLPFTPFIRVEILAVNIQCCSFSKRKMVRSENVLVSTGKFKRKRKNALIKSIAYNIWNVSNGMVCTISFSNQNFQVFRVNGKRPRSQVDSWLEALGWVDMNLTETTPQNHTKWVQRTERTCRVVCVVKNSRS